MLLSEFNDAEAAVAASVVRVWADIPTWVDAIVSARPYPSVASLTERAETLAAQWTTADLDAALAHHPRIGEQPTAFDSDAEASRREQSAMAGAGDELATAIAQGNAAYEERFGRVFLIRAAGRTPDEILANLERRLMSDPAAESDEASAQLLEIALLRLHDALTDDRTRA